jgi:hypothetical protein
MASGEAWTAYLTIPLRLPPRLCYRRTTSNGTDVPVAIKRLSLTVALEVLEEMTGISGAETLYQQKMLISADRDDC